MNSSGWVWGVTALSGLVATLGAAILHSMSERLSTAELHMRDLLDRVSALEAAIAATREDVHYCRDRIDRALEH